MSESLGQKIGLDGAKVKTRGGRQTTGWGSVMDSCKLLVSLCSFPIYPFYNIHISSVCLSGQIYSFPYSKFFFFPPLNLENLKRKSSIKSSRMHMQITIPFSNQTTTTTSLLLLLLLLSCCCCCRIHRIHHHQDTPNPPLPKTPSSNPFNPLTLSNNPTRPSLELTISPTLCNLAPKSIIPILSSSSLPPFPC